MNLLVKRLGQLAVLAVALFFFSCEDETSLGFKNPNPKFDIYSAEIDLPSSVLLMDSFRTSNFTFNNEFNRLLVGQYNDPELGKVQAGFYTQFFSPSIFPANSVYDSISLQLAFDLYHYGSSGTSTQTIAVYRLSEDIQPASERVYYNTSELSVPALPMSQLTFTVDPEVFEEYAEDEGDTVIRLGLPKAFGRQLYDFIIENKDLGTEPDSFSIYVDKFLSEFKGIAVKSVEGDKVVRFNPLSSRSQMTIHYHTDKDTSSFPLFFNTVRGFNNITSEFQGELGTLVPGQPAELSKGYVQSGTGLVTTLSFENLQALVDTVPNIVINEAQVVITDISTSGFAPPTSLSLRLIDENYNLLRWDLEDRKVGNVTVPVDQKDLFNYLVYGGTLQSDFSWPNLKTAAVFDADRGVYVLNDIGATAIYSFNNETKIYSGYVTNFIQQLVTRDARSAFNDFILYPVSPTGAKSVNRVTFPKDKIKLRLKYTKPKANPS